MTTTAKIIAFVVLVVLVGGGAYFVFIKKSSAPEIGVPQDTGNPQGTASGTPAVERSAPNRQGTTNPPSGEKIVGEEDVSGIPKTVVKPGVQNIEISNFAFFPNSIKVNLGTTVIWTNKDSVQHNVISDTGLFRGPLLAKGQVYSFLFSKAGTYTYYCGPHPWMTARIVVE